MCKQLFILLSFLCLVTPLLATHNHAGEIFFRKTGGMGLEATIITYTRASSVNADRDTLILHWGDGSSESLVRNNGFNHQGELLGNDIKKNTYTGIHTYTIGGIYWLSMTDPNRSGGIINVNPPNSDNIPFHLEAMVRLLPDAAESLYSPSFLEPAIDVAILQQPFVHAPNAFDADGDSLVYELAVPLQGSGSPVPNYSWPNEIAPGPNNVVVLDANTGKFSWNVPQEEGAYCISIVVRAYRNGILVEETRRDMLIDVDLGFFAPPDIAMSPDIAEEEVVEVVVGQTVNIAVTAADPNGGQNLAITATSGLLSDYFQNKATFSNAGIFSWTVSSEQEREQPYQVVFKAKDSLDLDGLATFRLLRFHVNAVTGVSGAHTAPVVLHLFPNPNPGTLRIDLPNPATTGQTLRIVDLAGRLIKEQTTQTGNKTQFLDIDGLQSGSYMLFVLSSGRVLSIGKFIKE